MPPEWHNIPSLKALKEPPETDTSFSKMGRSYPSMPTQHGGCAPFHLPQHLGYNSQQSTDSTGSQDSLMTQVPLPYHLPQDHSAYYSQPQFMQPTHIFECLERRRLIGFSPPEWHSFPPLKAISPLRSRLGARHLQCKSGQMSRSCTKRTYEVLSYRGMLLSIVSATVPRNNLRFNTSVR
jgi:hypothetical protein